MPAHGQRLGSGATLSYQANALPGAAKAGGGPGNGANKNGGGGGKGGKGAGTAINLVTYHGGSIFNSPWRLYDIYWVPPGYSVQAGYQAGIDGFAQNVAADSGKSSNVFSTPTQYTDGSSSHVDYSASFGGSATATNAFPASGCSDSALPNGPCLTDNQVAAEISTVASTNGWTVSYPNIFVVMMPPNVGNCATYTTGQLEGYCSFVGTCAWHHQWGSMYYIVQPYVGNNGPCETGQTPPASTHDASQAINTISHELSESLTDPAGGSWFDSSGDEIADKCAWMFGTALGGSSGSLYNQVINGTDYYLQQEWSNTNGGCVQRGT